MNKFVIMIFLTGMVAFKAILVSSEVLDERSLGAVVVSLGIGLLLASPVLMMKRGELLYAFIVDLIVTIALYVQFLYIGYFKVPMSMYVFLQASNAQGMGESVLGRIEWYHLVFFVDVVVLAVLYYFYKKKGMEVLKRDSKWMKYVFVLTIIAAIGFIALKPVSMVAKGLEGEMLRKYTPATFVGNYGIFGHQILDAHQVFFQNKEITLEKEEKNEIEAFLSKKQAIDAPVEGAEKGKFEGKNIVYLQMESLQDFVLNEKVEEKEITPFMNSLLTNSYHFSNFYPQTAEGNSSDAELLALTSIYPVREGSTFFRFPDKNYPSVLKDLEEKGYESYAFHGDEGDFWNRDAVFPNLGFEEYYDISDYENTQENLMGMGLSDRYFFEETAKMLNEKEQPFAGYAISLTSHYPFEMPQEEKTLALEGEMKGTYLGNYMETIHYADASLKAFFENLDEDVKKNTVFVIFGDHNGVFEAQKKEVEGWKGKAISSEEWVKDFSTIPFVVYNPEIEGQELERIGGQIDMAPTVAHLMGTKDREQQGFGINLFQNEKKSVFLLKGDYGATTVITDEGEIENYSEEEFKALDFSEKLIKSNFK